MGKFLQEEHIFEDPEAIVETKLNVLIKRVIDELLMEEDDQQAMERPEVVVQSFIEDRL